MATSFTSRIIKAGAVLDDTRVLLGDWDEGRSADENLRLALSANVFGRASRSRVEDLLPVLRSRYCRDGDVACALHRIVREKLSPHIVDRVLYYHTALSDPLIHAFVVDVLCLRQRRGDVAVAVDDAREFIRHAIRHRRVTAPWSEATQRRVAQGLLATLRDFRVLEGAVRKRIAPAHLPLPAFVWVAYHLRQRVAAGHRLVEHEDWRLFFLDSGDVERLFQEAHQHGCVRYEALGAVVRIEFPYASMREVADDLVSRRAGDALG